MPAPLLAVVRDRIVCDFLKHAASRVGTELVSTRNPGDALARAHARPPAGVVVGLDLESAAPALVRQFRSDLALASTPLLLVGRPGEEPRAAAALELGAVGFIRLPVDGEQAAERLREIIEWRRGGERERLVVAGPASIDLVSRRLLRPRALPSLTRCEFEILRWLLTPAGRTYTRRQLVAADRAAYPPVPEEWMVDANVQSLKRKLGEAGDWIEVVPGIGYRFAKPRRVAAAAEALAFSS